MPLIPLPAPHGALDRLAMHCMAARAMIDETGTPVMRRLIDLLLFEIGVALAEPPQIPSEAGAIAPDPREPLTTRRQIYGPVLVPAE